MIINAMVCLEKKKLQDRCTAAWNEFEAESPQSVAHFNVRTIGWVRDAIGTLSLSPTGLRLRWEHLKASQALSMHFSGHRC